MDFGQTTDLEAFFDSGKIRSLLTSLKTVTGAAVAIISLDGTVLFGERWLDICLHFYRSISDSKTQCIKNNEALCGDLIGSDKHLFNECPHGLMRACEPLMIGNIHVANIFVGRFLSRPLDSAMLKRFERQADLYGFDPVAHRQALSTLPVLTSEQVESILQIIGQMVELLSVEAVEDSQREFLENAAAEVNQRLMSEIQLRRIETRKLNQIVSGNPMPTFVIDTHHRVTHWNRACEVMTGLPAEYMIGTDRHREAFYEASRPLLADLVIEQSKLDEVGVYYNDTLRKSPLIKDGFDSVDFFPKLGDHGKWLHFSAVAMKDDQGRVIGAIEIFQDISAQRQTEQRLQESAAHYRQLFESANDAIFLLQDGAVADCNPKAEALFESTRERLLGKTPDLLSPKVQPTGEGSIDEIKKRIRALTLNTPYLFDWRFKKENGKQFDAEVSLTGFLISEKPYALAIVRDISQRQLLIRELTESKAELDEKTRYLERVNRALKESLDHRELEKRAIEENILVNLKRFIFPYLEELRQCRLDADAKAYLSILDNNLNDVVSQFSDTVFSKYIDFTPTEIRIADFIKGGKDTKAIAGLLNLSPSSIQWHRKNIRKKLGLTDTKLNLFTYLNSLKN